jgi:precorrin-2/cobalt-factor-2 C20-methyltransferase
MQPRLIAVGVGPGDPELLTLKGARLLREAGVVITPVGDRSDSSISHGIVDGIVDPARQKVLTQVFPMKKKQTGLEESWFRSAQQIAELVRGGETVAFVTLGDPFLYSTFLYLYRQLQDHFPDIPLEIVSGVSSINAAAAAAHLPLGLADECLAVVPAAYGAERLAGILQEFDTVVLVKVHRVFDRIREILTEVGLKDRAVFVRRVGLAGEAVITDLDRVEEEDLDYLSLVIVRKGEVKGEA